MIFRHSVGNAKIAMLAGLPFIAFVALVAAVPFLVDGIYTKEQAERGHQLYDAQCADCHGTKLEGTTSTPLTGPPFIASWGRPDLTLDDFFYIVRKTMPKDAAGSLTREQYADVVAYILQQNGFRPGERELVPGDTIMKTIRFGTTSNSPSSRSVHHEVP